MADLENRGPEILAVAILFFVLCWISVGLRIYTRGVLLRCLGLDDKLMIVLLGIFTGYLISQLQSVRYGNGRHDAVLTPENRQKALMWWYICELIYIPSTCLLKIIVGFSLLRIATRRLHTRILHLLMATTTLFGGTYFVLVLVQCRPIATFWLMSPRARPQCFPDHIVIAMTYTASVLNCAADWAFALLPALLVIPLRLPLRTRLGLAAILALAALGSTATIVRAVYIPHLLSGADFLHTTADVALWSTVEPGLGITAANLATLRPLWRAARRRALSSVRHYTPAPGTGKAPAGTSETASASTKMHRLRPENVHSDSIVSAHHREDVDKPKEESSYRSSSRRPSPRSASTQSRGIRKTTDVSVSRSRATNDNNNNNNNNDDDDDEALVPPPPAIHINYALEYDDDDDDEHDRERRRRSTPPSFVDRFSADESDDIERGPSDSLDRSRRPVPTFSGLSPTAPSLDWSSPRVSAISMGFCRDKRSSRAAWDT
ncbi:hypothetical protein ACHAQA_002326 [Verticillium albo-atrum]